MVSFSAFLVAACASQAKNIPTGIEALNVPSQTAPSPPLATYRIGPLDEIRVTVFREPELTTDAVVDIEGNVNLPLIGAVTALGQTTSSLAAEVQAKLNRRYLRDSNVTVAILKPNSYTFTIEGELKKPGTYSIPGQVTLLQAIAIAEGVTERARLSEVVVFRRVDGVQYAARFDLRQIRLALAEDPVLSAGDTVVVNYSAAQQIYKDILTVVPGLAGIFIALGQ